MRYQRFVRQRQTGLHQDHRQSVLLRVMFRTIYLGWRLQWWSRRWLRRRRLRQPRRLRLRRQQLRLVLLLLARLIASASVLSLFPLLPVPFLLLHSFQFLFFHLARCSSSPHGLVERLTPLHSLRYFKIHLPDLNIDYSSLVISYSNSSASEGRRASADRRAIAASLPVMLFTSQLLPARSLLTSATCS